MLAGRAPLRRPGGGRSRRTRPPKPDPARPLHGTVRPMCGRFVSSTPPAELAATFSAEAPREQLVEPNFNVAPTNDVWAVRVDPDEVRRLVALHWGLVPRWAKDPGIGSRMINARAETLADKNAYKAAYRSRRCLIPADGFYEWKAVHGSKVKQPYFIHRNDGVQMAFAGLYEIWRSPANPNEELHSCTIITGRPNTAVRPVHDRMPVILQPSSWDRWLDPALTDPDVLDELLAPLPADVIDLHPVSRDVGKVSNKQPELIVEIPPDEVLPGGELPGRARSGD